MAAWTADCDMCNATARLTPEDAEIFRKQLEGIWEKFRTVPLTANQERLIRLSGVCPKEFKGHSFINRTQNWLDYRNI